MSRSVENLARRTRAIERRLEVLAEIDDIGVRQELLFMYSTMRGLSDSFDDIINQLRADIRTLHVIVMSEMETRKSMQAEIWRLKGEEVKDRKVSRYDP